MTYCITGHATGQMIFTRRKRTYRVESSSSTAEMNLPIHEATVGGGHRRLHLRGEGQDMPAPDLCGASVSRGLDKRWHPIPSRS